MQHYLFTLWAILLAFTNLKNVAAEEKTKLNDNKDETKEVSTRYPRLRK